MNPKALLPVSFLFLLISSSCQKEEAADPIEATPAGVFGAQTTLNVAGVVVDEAGAPVTGATVIAGFGSQSTTSDANGAFRIQGITGYNGLGLIRVSKQGYFPGSRSFLPAGSLNTVRVTLLTRQLAGTVDGATGGEVSVQGATVAFGASSFSLNGAPYSGEVRVYMKQLDPTAPDFVDQMPGSLIALQEDALRALVSYGMLVVELTDDQGQRVELSEGTTAEMHFPITANQQTSAPSTIDLWWYDEVAGFWRHEGTASREGIEYIATVSHFSFWNCDMPFETVQLTGNLTSGGAPIPGALVTLISTLSGSASDYTGQDGEFGGYAPAGQSLTLNVAIDCPANGFQIVHTFELGVINSNTDLGSLNVESSIISSITGNIVDCDGEPLAEGYVLANGSVYFCNNGVFSFNSCSGESITLIGVNPIESASSSSVEVLLEDTPLNIGTLIACGQNGVPFHLNPDLSYGTVSDVEGNQYATIQIGEQEWMAENLRTSSYSNGDPIENVPEWNDWWPLTTGGWVYYENSPQYNFPFGKLYNWYAVSDTRGVCPSGWHVPTDDEWKELETSLGMPALDLDGIIDRGSEENVGGKMKSIGESLWIDENVGGTNESGFSAAGSGRRGDVTGDYVGLGESEYWWTSSSEDGALVAWARSVSNYQSGVNRIYPHKRETASVRCVRD